FCISQIRSGSRVVVIYKTMRRLPAARHIATGDPYVVPRQTVTALAIVLFTALSTVLVFAAASEAPKPVPPNYDESKRGQYSLPDALTLISGERVAEAEPWYQFRRTEILHLFSSYVYGRTPEQKLKMRCQPFDVAEHALGGTALRKQVTCSFDEKDQVRKMDILLYLPASAQKPVPLFLGLNFSGNQTVNADPGIKLADVW